MSHLPDLLGWWFHLLDLMERQSQLHGSTVWGTVPPQALPSGSPFLGLHRMTLTSIQRSSDLLKQRKWSHTLKPMKQLRWSLSYLQSSCFHF